MKTFNYNGSRWHSIKAEDNEEMRKEGFVVLCRPVSLSQLKKRGYMATKINAKPENLPTKARLVAEDIVSGY